MPKRDNKERKKSEPYERRVKEHYERKNYCKVCGSSNHTTSRCYFRNKICFECAQTGHKASMCTKRNYQQPKKINVVLSKVMKNKGKRKYVNMKVNGQNITCLLDTGSDISTIDETTWKKIGKPELRNTGKIVRDISGRKLKFKGEFDAKVTLDGETYKTKIYAIAGKNANLFGIDLIVLFDLWEKLIKAFCRKLNASSMGKSKQTENFVNKLKSEFNKVLADELGCCMKTEVRFKLKDNVKPVFKPKRKVPFSSLETIDEELRRLEETGVIKKVDYSEWASTT